VSTTNNVSKSKIHGLWALTNRELKKWYKAPVVFILTLIQPVLWLGLLGNALNIGSLFSASSFTPPVLTPPLTATQAMQLGQYFQDVQGTV
jgi:ABC-2 type transport system permease protein